MSIQEGFFVVDGIFHTDLPVAFSQLTDDNFGVPDNVLKTADGKRITTVQAPQLLDLGDYRDYYHRRKIHIQAWKAEWGEQSLMTVFMAEQLRDLYETQKQFWIQYDDEMSRCWGRLIGLNADLEDGNNPHVYFTPHYPIFPYGHEPLADPEAAGAWDNMLWVANELWTGDFDVYSDYGMVVLPADNKRFNDRIKVHLKYTWRAYVRIREMNLQPIQLAQTYYTGEVAFEVVAIPVTGVPLEWRDPPYTGICTYYARVRTSSFSKIAIVALVNGYSYGDVISTPRTPVSPVQVKAIVYAGKNATPYKYGQTPVSPIRIIVPVGGGGVTGNSTAVGAIGTTKGSTGVGWASNVSSKQTYEVISDADPSSYAYGSTFSAKFELSDLSDPDKSTGHVMSVDWSRMSGNTTKLTVYLLQGERVIAQPQFTRSADGLINDSYTLSNAEADSITDYNDLWVKFYADYQSYVSWFGFVLPPPTIKYSSIFGTITVQATAYATRTLAVGYPVLAQIRIKTAAAAGITGYADQGQSQSEA